MRSALVIRHETEAVAIFMAAAETGKLVFLAFFFLKLSLRSCYTRFWHLHSLVIKSITIWVTEQRLLTMQ
jgi:hypothetical protein